MSAPQITLTARLSPSALDTRRGVVRLHPEVLDALGLRAWDAVRLTGARVSSALAAAGDRAAAPGVVLVDDVTLSNVGITEGSELVVAPVEVAAARTVTVSGSRLAQALLSPEMVRLALIGKVITTGDAVSLLPQDLAPAPGADVTAARRMLSTAIGMTWTTELITVSTTEPAGVVAIRPATVLSWRDGTSTPSPTEPSTVDDAPPVDLPAPEPVSVPPVTDLVGADEAVRRLTEWFELAFRQPELLQRLGSSGRLGAVVSGPEGVGKTTLVRAVTSSVGATLVELAAPGVSALEANAAAARVRAAVDTAIKATRSGKPAVLLLTDVDVLLPATNPQPVSTVVLDTLRAAVRTPLLALVCTTSHAGSVDHRLRGPDLVDRELTLPAPDARMRTELLRILLRRVPSESDVDLGAIAELTPGFVVADLGALCREAAVRAAIRQRDADEPKIGQQDLLGALDTVRPVSMSTSDVVMTGGLTLDDVGDMADVKQSLTETVLWPLQYPDSFARLGIEPPRGVLLYGPPGCGKTFIVRALAGSGRLNVLSVKGAELMDKWVGESERAVRELFARARQAAPTLVFLDEVDALAPRRGQSSDSGVADRVVAALLTELDGVQPVRDVVVLGATNRPELVDPALLRPGRLERVVYVPPPDAEARAAILRSTARNTPLADDVDLAAVAAGLDGYSAADCAAVLREAALTAMRESLDATVVTSKHMNAALAAVRPSLDPVQLAEIAGFADQRRS
ncbi:MAG TPA: AAA family ATPase [Pseudonocardiaceae bacterium]|nr:AAA family ATPase [Pseudonocardiaceae bacterium]